MPANIDIYTPRHMATVVSVAPPIHTFLRDTFFTDVQTFATERVDFDLVKGDRRMAAFINPRHGAEVLTETGYETQTYAPPVVSPADITTADQLMTRLPGEDIYSGMTPAERAARKLVSDYNRLNDAVTRREEWMCAKALFEGKIPILGKGVNEEIDFRFTNKVALDKNHWGTDTADIIGDLSDWAEKIADCGCPAPDTLIVGKQALNAIRKDEKLYKLLDNRRMDFGELNVQYAPGVKRIGYLADPGLDIYYYGEKYLDDWTDPAAPKVCPLVPEDSVGLFYRGSSYMMAYGLCTYLDNNETWVTAQTNRLFRSYTMRKPDRRMIELQTRPLPIPRQVDSWLIAKVINTSG